MKILMLCLLLAPVCAAAADPAKPQDAPDAAAAPEAMGAEANARQRREKHASHREKMTVLHEQMRAAKTPAERAAVQNSMRELRAARKAEMRRSGGSVGIDGAPGKRRRGEGKGDGKGGGRGDGNGRGDGSGGGRKDGSAPGKTDAAAKEKPADRKKTGKP